MELFLLVIASLVAYIAYRMKTVVVPSLWRPGAFPPKRIRGKATIEFEILLPKRLESSPFRIEYEVTHAGLLRTLKIDVLARFSSRNSDKKYVWGEGLIFASPEFTTPGVDPGETSLILTQEIAIQGYLFCSPQAFDFLIRELSDRKSVVLSVYGPVIKKDEDRVEMASNSFHLHTEGAMLEHFLKGYLNYIECADPEATESLRGFARQFDIRKH